MHPSGVATMPRGNATDYPRKSLPNFSTLQHSTSPHSKKESLSYDKKMGKLRYFNLPHHLNQFNSVMFFVLHVLD